MLSVLSEQFYLFGREFLFRVHVEEPTQGDAERADDENRVVRPECVAVVQGLCYRESTRPITAHTKAITCVNHSFGMVKQKIAATRHIKNSANGTRNSLFIA